LWILAMIRIHRARAILSRLPLMLLCHRHFRLVIFLRFQLLRFNNRIYRICHHLLRHRMDKADIIRDHRIMLSMHRHLLLRQAMVLVNIGWLFPFNRRYFRTIIDRVIIIIIRTHIITHIIIIINFTHYNYYSLFLIVMFSSPLSV